MLPDFCYAIAAALLLLAIAVLSTFRAGRRSLVRALPAAAFFALLLGTAEGAFHVGRARGGAGTTSGAATIYTCSMHPQVQLPEPGTCPICHMELVPMATLTAGAGASAHEVQIEPRVVQNMGVRLHTVQRGRLERSTRAFGELRYAISRYRDVTLKVTGYVESLAADTPGMRLAAGDALFELYAPELVVAQAELLAARTAGDAGLVASARQKLRLWDVADAEIDRIQALAEPERTLRWTSPIRGVLLEKNVVAGAQAMAGQLLLRIADLSELWLDAQVPEGQLADIALGQAATATFPALPELELRGTVAFVAPDVDAATRTAVVRVAIADPDARLRPGMFARVQLHAVTPGDALLAPAEAILDTGTRQLAWVAVGKGRFEPRAVHAGPADDHGMVAVADGLADGDVVVTSGQFLIDAESRLREGMRKFEDDDLMHGGELPAAPAARVADTTQQALDALLAAYGAVAAALAADGFDPAAWTTLRQAAAAAAAAPEAAVQKPAADLALALQKPATDLEAMRVAFKQVSAAALRLFEAARPRGDAEHPRLYVQHCPMAEADWLQADAATKNPYYGSSMLDCGAVRRELPLAAPPGGGR